jgi:hypothetical protein
MTKRWAGLTIGPLFSRGYDLIDILLQNILREFDLGFGRHFENFVWLSNFTLNKCLAASISFPQIKLLRALLICRIFVYRHYTSKQDLFLGGPGRGQSWKTCRAPLHRSSDEEWRGRSSSFGIIWAHRYWYRYVRVCPSFTNWLAVRSSLIIQYCWLGPTSRRHLADDQKYHKTSFHIL